MNYKSTIEMIWTLLSSVLLVASRRGTYPLYNIVSIGILTLLIIYNIYKQYREKSITYKKIGKLLIYSIASSLVCFLFQWIDHVISEYPSYTIATINKIFIAIAVYLACRSLKPKSKTHKNSTIQENL